MKDAIEFTNRNPICYFATSVNNQPYVRALGFWFADESGFYFQTGAMKEMVGQLKANPKSEVCFYELNDMAGKMLRIEGEIEFVDDRKLKEKCLEDRPFLKQFGLTPDDPNLIIFRIPKGRGHFWTWENNLKPKEYFEF